MAQAAKRIPEFEQPAEQPWTDWLVGEEAVTWNPVRQMHARLRSEFADGAAVGTAAVRASGLGLRGRVGIIVGASVMLWSAIIYCGWMLLA